ncbi:hypothetical protein N7468_010015 [Penicillium chermesinum]|uniref:Uncharacterized protein n=1 Tax=Penicillium chermesinum TaxID=63820 RepID=A0A9W9TBU9_9EURO|nr:uncharacterized protein N7468_010015 [Penicillium chermesinum]KAJ5217007.1 hypothetical protein N7468_010015 [Penicillium chermesinum]
MGDFKPDLEASVAPAVVEAKGLNGDSHESGVLYRQLRQKPLNIVSGKGSYVYTDTGLEILDATCGAAVSCLGHNDKRVHDAIMEQLQKVSYTYSVFFTNSAMEDLCKLLVDSTGGQMSRAFIVASGKPLRTIDLAIHVVV